jgi:hypothetical protein
MGAERKQDRVTVGRRLRYLAGSDIAGGTGDVLYIDLLAELLGQLLRHEPREGIGHSTGRKRNDRPHWPRRIGLRPCNPGHGRQHASAGGQMQERPAGKFHCRPSPGRLFGLVRVSSKRPLAPALIIGSA